MKKSNNKIYIINLDKCLYLIDGNEIAGNFVMLGEKELLTIQGKTGLIFNGWKDTEIFDSSLSKLIIKRPQFQEELL